MTVTHSWARPGFEAFPRMFARASLPFGFERVAVLGKRVVFSRVDDLPEAAATEKACCAASGRSRT